MLHSSYSLRTAEKEDFQKLSAFLDADNFIHRHLDWKSPLEWLGCQPFWILEKDQEIAGVLACPPDPANICWVRLFAVRQGLSPAKAWQVLFDRCLDEFSSSEKKIIFASVVLKEWFIPIMKANHFIHHQEIVVLEWDNDLPPSLPTLDDLILRPMRIEDLKAVSEVDHQSFAQLWQNSEEGLTLAFQREGISTVATINEKVVGYQISTTNLMNTHLARLAVLPEMQHKNIGYALVRDLLSRVLQVRSWQVTVNTQHDNASSLALYNKMGFRKTGDHFPVYIFIKT
jgi:ribosomal protein S18 acetylase RimI-like enzyme